MPKMRTRVRFSSPAPVGFRRAVPELNSGSCLVTACLLSPLFAELRAAAPNAPHGTEDTKRGDDKYD
jgi:hypothetical protein